MQYDSYMSIFKPYLYAGMTASGELDFPTIYRVKASPKNLIGFDKSLKCKDYDQWVHFFIHDYLFVRILRNPQKYLAVLSKFEGAIAPDFSVFWNYPLFSQMQSIFYSRLIGSWLQRNGISVIPCVRWGKEETYNFAFDGLEQGGTIAVGTAGCIREGETRQVFESGFPVMLNSVKPNKIIVYGSTNSEVFSEAQRAGIEVISFQTETAKLFSKRRHLWD